MSVNDPNIVELTFPADGLEFQFDRRIIEFHKSRHIQPRYGRQIARGREPILGLDRNWVLKGTIDPRRGAADRGQYRQAAGITKDVITCPHWRPNSVSDALLDDGRNLPPAGSRRYGHCALCLVSSDPQCALRGGKPSARHSRRPGPV